jgi:glycosyltransferase 2 family protein
MPRPSRFARLRAPAPLIVSIVALLGCAWWVSRQEAPEPPGSSSAIALLAGSLVVYAGITVLRGYRFHVILRTAELPHKTADAYQLTVVSYMGNVVLPARGGEILRILLLADRAGVRRRDVIGAVIPERLLDAASLALLFALIALGGRSGDEIGIGTGLAVLGGLVAAAVAVAAYWRLRQAGRLGRLADRVRPLTRGSRRLLNGTGLRMALLSVGIWLLEACVFWLVASAHELDVGLGGAAFAVVAASFLSLVPAGPGFIGTFDAGILFALGVLDVHGGAAVSTLLTYRFVVFVPITVAGLALALTRYGGLGMLRRRVSGARDEEELLAEQPPGERRAQVPAHE